MAKSSIHIKPVKSTSEAHNKREVELDYNFKDLTKNNESFIKENINSRLESIKEKYTRTTRQSMQKKATPIREGVVNLNAHHSMRDLKKLAEKMEAKFGIKTFQIYIHRDEGKSKDELNYHAHMVFDWTDSQTGKSLRLNKVEMSKMQTLVAEELKMERGISKTNTNTEHLEATEYKRQQEENRLKELQKQRFLEEKKNQRVTKRFENEARKIAVNIGKFKPIKNRTLRQRAIEIQRKYIATGLQNLGQTKERNEQANEEYRQLKKVYNDVKELSIEIEKAERNIKEYKRRNEATTAESIKLAREIERFEK